MLTRTNPGYARDVRIDGTPTSSYCNVLIVEEGLILCFERESDGIIRANPQRVMKEHPDLPNRASRPGFEQARELARKTMNDILKSEVNRSTTEEPVIRHANIKECLLAYAGNVYSFICEVDQQLTWDNVRLGGTFTSSSSKNSPRVFLTDEEYHKLKERSIARICSYRKGTGTYGRDGKGPFVGTKQLSLAL